MFNRHSVLFILSAFTLLTSCYTAHQSCSTVQTPYTSQKALSTLSRGCTIDSNENFSIEIPLSKPSESSAIPQLHLDLSNDQENFHINLIPDLRNDDKYDLEVISPEGRETYSLLPSISISLVVSQGVCTISFKNSSIKLTHKFTGVFPYTLSIQLPHEQTLTTKKEASFRFLTQCSGDYLLVEGACMRVCPAKQFSHNGVCSRCSDNCYTGRCISERLCNPCRSNETYFKETGACIEKCPEFYFEDYNNKICVKCADGCKSCSFPNGLCSSSYFKTDMIINLIVSVVLLSLITLCACCCNKEKAETAKTATQEQQAEQGSDQNNQGKAKAQSDHLKKAMGIDPKSSYVVLQEGLDFDDQEEEEEELGSALALERRNKKRLNEYAKSKLLSITMHKKGFMIDDADEEKAISHGSAGLSSKGGSLSALTSKTNSPLFKSKRRDSRNAIPQSSFAADKRSRNNVDETMTPQQNSYSELASPYANCSGLVAKKDSSLGLMIAKKKESSDPANFLDGFGEDNNEIKIDLQHLRPPLELPEFDKTPDTVHEAAEIEEIEEIEEEEIKEKEGYKCDSSLNMSKETDGAVDFNACTICCMNKRDCLNRPCGHMVGCYACMEQFKKDYGVCPRCKKQLNEIQKVGSEKK